MRLLSLILGPHTWKQAHPSNLISQSASRSPTPAPPHTGNWVKSGLLLTSCSLLEHPQPASTSPTSQKGSSGPLLGKPHSWHNWGRYVPLPLHHLWARVAAAPSGKGPLTLTKLCQGSGESSSLTIKGAEHRPTTVLTLFLEKIGLAPP